MAIKSLAALIINNPTALLLSITISTTILNLSQSQNDHSSDDYDRCAPFDCGNINFTFPFFSDDSSRGLYDCGLPGFQIVCDQTPIARLMLSSRLYRVKDLYPIDNTITVVDQSLIDGLRSGSCENLGNLTISTSTDVGIGAEVSFRIPYGTNFTFFRCPNSPAPSLPVVGNFSCEDGSRAYLWDDERWNHSPPGPPPLSTVETPDGCKLVTVPVSDASLLRNGFLNRSGDESGDRRMGLLFDVLRDGFPLEWSNETFDYCAWCQLRHGRCAYDRSSGKTTCLCKGGCVMHKSKRWKLVLGVALGSTFAVLAAVALIMFKSNKRIPATFKTYFRENQVTGDQRNAKHFVKNYQSTLLTNYSFNEIKKMTNGFEEKLGEGGYGNVFKGKLSDGRFIAVKMLDNYKDNSENFMNEVTTIGRIHHVNVIRLLGFCWDGSKQALIYEYMPNGSLGDYISREEVSLSLGLKRLIEISIGVAHGIEYLHNGCESRILHLDIKPQNVLLDLDFNPKISDFGLAKVYSRNKSAVTMTGAKGTIGYIAPEIFLRNLGNPSHKSDVYSFGMLLLEMVGGRKNVEPEMSNSSEAYFPGWIYDKLIEEKDMEISDSVIEEKVCITRKMVMVGLWCIQINPRDRPSMTRVVEMLSGNVEAIEMPPKPFFFSPPRVQFEHETTSVDSDKSVLPLTLNSQEI